MADFVEKKDSCSSNATCSAPVSMPPFEGPEKTLEIDFVPTVGHEKRSSRLATFGLGRHSVARESANIEPREKRIF